MRFGRMDVEIVSGGRFKLDGGGMFGVIPHALWSRAHKPDERNRIQMDTNCLLVRTESEVVLIDTGNGSKMGEKERDIFGLEPGAGVVQSLAQRGVRPEDVTTVLLTHLHMDHVGGATRYAGDEVVPAFPNARFVVQRQEWEDALRNRSHMRTTYRTENLLPLEASGRLHLLEGDCQVAPGVTVHVTGGHTTGHQCVFLFSEGRTIWYPADICPTPTHVRAPYNMAYDMEPYVTMQVKGELLRRAAEEGWLVVFDHEPEHRVARIESEGTQLRAVTSVMMPEDSLRVAV